MRADQLMRTVRRLIDSGRVPPGGRLPPERQLCADLGASRTLLRSVLSELEAEGRIWRNVGQGTFVGGRPVRTANDIALVSGRTSPSEVMEVRLVIEPHAAFFAALRATDDDLVHLQHCLSKLEGAPNHANYARWDSTLHRALAEASHNALLLTLFDAVNAVRNQPGWTSVWQRIVTPNVETYRRQHADILTAVFARAPEQAREAMRVHLTSVHDSLIGRTPRDVRRNKRSVKPAHVARKAGL